MEMIRTELSKMKQRLSAELPEENIQDERAFVFLCLNLFFMPKSNCSQLKENITDGPRDGGLDFVFFDEDENKINASQCKLTENLSNEDIINEFTKIEATINDFRRVNTSRYNAKVQELLQNSMDRFILRPKVGQ